MATPQTKFRTFAEFWPYYLGAHAKRGTRILHHIGLALAALSLLGAIVFWNWYLLVVALFFSYGPAWIGHALIEHNRPATFDYPWWSAIGDIRMGLMALTGRLDGELKRLGID